MNRRATDRPHRVALVCIVAAAAVAFVAGRMSPRDVEATVRRIEAMPVPSELPAGIERFHDAAQGVTCWRIVPREPAPAERDAGISCLPDQWLLQQQDDAT